MDLTCIDKVKLKAQALDELKQRLQVVVDAAFEAKEASTNEESKAENKYDTRGLEASYLAAGQATRAQELKKSIYYLEQFEVQGILAEVNLGALVHLGIDGEEEKLFFILPIGGLQLEIDQGTVYTIALDAPLAKLMFKKSVGDFFDFKQREYEILSIS
jgi:transcription elongation GreA/GreB family factor